MVNTHGFRAGCSIVLFVVTIALALAMPAEAGELRGAVRSVSGDVVTISCEGGISPNPGDPIKIGFEVPNVGFVALEGSWEVSLIGPGGEVLATPTTEEHGQPRSGHVVLITTAGSVTTPPRGATPQGSGAPSGRTAISGPDRSGLPPFARRPWMGLRLERNEADATSGVTVVAVHQGGSASRAGIRNGDVILAVNGTPTPNSVVLDEVTNGLHRGDAISMRLLRLPDVVEVSVRSELPDLDEPVVQTKIGYDFLNGNEIARDERRGIEWLERAAAQGFQDAIGMLDEYRGRSAGGRGSTDRGSTRSQTSTVYIAGNEEGKRPAWFVLETGIFNTVAAQGAPVRDLPPDIWPRRNNLSSPDEVFRSLQPLGGGWLLWVEVSIHWGHLGFAKDRVSVQCFDPAGRLKWKEDASNVMANSADHSVQLLADKINKKLRKKRGKPCMRP